MRTIFYESAHEHVFEVRSTLNTYPPWAVAHNTVSRTGAAMMSNPIAHSSVNRKERDPGWIMLPTVSIKTIRKFNECILRQLSMTLFLHFSSRFLTILCCPLHSTTDCCSLIVDCFTVLQPSARKQDKLLSQCHSTFVICAFLLWFS